MSDVLWWSLSAAMILAGLAGTVLPALPGTALVLAGILLGAWIDDFTRVGPGVLALITGLAVLSFALEYLAGLLGAKRAGASRWALVGAALGTVLGLLMGLVGVLFMPLVGAALGEYLVQRRSGGLTATAAALPPNGHPQAEAARKALHVGVSAWLGLMVGMVAKVVLGFVMVGIFLASIWF